MSVNKVILLGHIGQDPKINESNKGTKICSFSLATSERAFKTASGVEVPERTEWHNVVMFGKLAEIAETYLHKGDKVYLEGMNRTRSYEGKDGVKRYTTEVHISTMEMLTPKPSGGTPPPPEPEF